MVTALLLMTAAWAQEPAADAYPARTEIDFRDIVDVTGRIARPNGIIINEQRQLLFNPLIRLRGDFDPEMVQSIQEIH